MEKFPKIKAGQVALLRANTQYGHVLDEAFDIDNNDKQKVYTIFDSPDEALAYANKFILESSEYEFTIFDHNNELLQFSSPLRNNK